MKKLLAILLAAAMLCSFACVGAFAEPTDIEEELISEGLIDEEPVEEEPVEDELWEEALGYIAQMQDIFDSGTFTLKTKSRVTGNLFGDEITTTYHRSEVWVYDRENDSKLAELDMKEFSKISASTQGASLKSKTMWYIAKAVYLLALLATGQKLRGFQIGTGKFASLPQRRMYSSDVSEIPLLKNFGHNVRAIVDWYVNSDDVLEVTKEGNRVSLLFGDRSRYYEFTDGKLSFYREVKPTGMLHEEYVESLSPEADQSYFSTEGMRKISLNWLAGLLGWVEGLLGSNTRWPPA